MGLQLELANSRGARIQPECYTHTGGFLVEPE